MTSMLYRSDLISPYRPLEKITRNNRWLSTACPLIERILHGRRAKFLRDDVPDGGILVTLPMWLWMMPAEGALGRKSGDLMPARITLDDDETGHSCVLLIEDDEKSVTYRAKGLGREVSGTLAIAESHDVRDDSQSPGCVTLIPDLIACRRMDRADLIDTLDALIASGEEAWWKLLMELDHYVRISVNKSHWAVTAEIAESLGAGDSIAGVLDPEGLEEVITGMTLGVSSKKAPAMKVIDKLLEPHRFERVDPQKYISTELSRTAGQRIRARIGDPHIGQRIRRLVAEMPDADDSEIIEAYRESNPRDELSVGRFGKAMSAGPIVEMRSVPLTDENIVGLSDAGADPFVHVSRSTMIDSLRSELSADDTEKMLAALYDGDVDEDAKSEIISHVRSIILDRVERDFLDEDTIASLISDLAEARR